MIFIRLKHWIMNRLWQSIILFCYSCEMVINKNNRDRNILIKQKLPTRIRCINRFCLKITSQFDVFAPSTVLITQNAKLLPGESGFRMKTDTPYVALTGELWGVYFEDFGEFDGDITAPHCICNFHQLSWLRWSRVFEAFLLELDGLFSLHSQYQDTPNTDDLTKQGPMVSVAMAALFYFSWNIPSSAAELKTSKTSWGVCSSRLRKFTSGTKHVSGSRMHIYVSPGTVCVFVSWLLHQLEEVVF